MLNLVLLGEDYEQDIKPLVKAFFENEDFNVVKSESSIEALSGLTLYIKLLMESYYIKLYNNIEVFYECNKIVEFQPEDKYLPGTDYYADRNRRIYRNNLHRSIYDILSEYTKKTLPWGTLTGIRPTKQVFERICSGESKAEIKRFMKDEYYCSDEKFDLSYMVAKREKEILDDIDYLNGYSVYIGIPFCPTTCAYCSFTSYPLLKYSDMVEPYINALRKEIDYVSECFPNKKLCTVYFGGGTPTTLTASQLDYLLSYVNKKFDMKNIKELTVEAGRPDSITADKLKVLKEHKVDRISINPQTMKQKTLDLIGRKHTAEQIKEAFYMAREAGHNNINMDIIIGLTGENPDDVSYTLDKIREFNPESITVHTLALKRAARLNTDKDKFEGMKAFNVAEMLRRTRVFAKENDYKPYYLYRQKNMAENLENIGYARYGYEGIYNILIMEEKQTILALGAGGSSKFVFNEEKRIERVENVKSLKDYIERIDEMIRRKSQFINDNFC